MPLRNLYWPLLLASLSDGNCRIAVNRCRPSFDGNACDLALLCTPSCRNSPGGPPRTVSLSRDTVPEEEAAHLVAAAAHLVANMAHTPSTGPHSRIGG